MVESIWWGQAALAATHERSGRGKVHGAGLGAACVQLAAGLGAALGLGRDGPQARGTLGGALAEWAAR
jgi:L-aminopeptidase/D-esterase-like protein